MPEFWGAAGSIKFQTVLDRTNVRTVPSEQKGWTPHMSEMNTSNFDDGRTFEQRVFARFDALDSRVDSLESRVEKRFDTVDTAILSLNSRVERLEIRFLRYQTNLGASVKGNRRNPTGTFEAAE